MKRVASSESLAIVSHWRNVLEQNGIACFIRNEQLSGALGEVPFLECLPELWVVDENRLSEAESILTELRSESPAGQAWRCPRCREENEAQFAACWNCGTADSRD